MFDINNKEIEVGQYLKVIGCKVKGDNSIYIVDHKYNDNSYCLYKVLQNGEVSKTKYNIYFLDNKYDLEKVVTVIDKSELKQAAKEVKNYINGITSGEVVYSFSRTAEQEIKEGLYIHWLKHINLVGHINSFCGTYEITHITNDGKVCLHLIGKRGERIADNMNSYYQFQPINLYFSAKTMKKFTDENYYEVLERHSTTKVELNANPIVDSVKEPETAETITDDIASTDTESTTETHIEPLEADQNKQDYIIKIEYYTINESSARTAKQINSFYDYKENEATNSYRSQVDKVAKLAQEKINKYPDCAGEIQNKFNYYNKKYAEWLNKYYRVECMCPSVMISGAGNFPVRKKEKQNSARDRIWEQYSYIQKLESDVINYNPADKVIKSSDSDALEQLKQKLSKLQAEHDKIIEYNKKARKEGKEQAATYILSNLNQNIKSVEGRIKEIERLKQQATEGTKADQYTNSVCEVIENAELMRIQLMFDYIPSVEERNILKSNGFKWSPNNKAWQRQLTDNARYSTKKVIKQLEELNSKTA
jgi:hypothetical protein